MTATTTTTLTKAERQWPEATEIAQIEVDPDEGERIRVIRYGTFTTGIWFWADPDDDDPGQDWMMYLDDEQRTQLIDALSWDHPARPGEGAAGEERPWRRPIDEINWQRSPPNPENVRRLVEDNRPKDDSAARESAAAVERAAVRGIKHAVCALEREAYQHGFRSGQGMRGRDKPSDSFGAPHHEARDNLLRMLDAIPAAPDDGGTG